MGFALWQYCQPDANGHQTYVFDLAEVTEVRDSGLAWLMMFQRRARRAGAHVGAVSVAPALEKRLAQAGIRIDDEIEPWS
jgi:Anti-anti-sigma regulatory factor (antagonist of anti-sigma factor)